MPSIQPEPPVHPVQRAKGPWAMKAESYMLFMRLKELPKGVYDPLQEEWSDEENGKFQGGLGAVMVVRYLDTPVGPYDELILVPGNFAVPQPASGLPKIPKRALRISRIYVSQRTTVYNGRLNWNIPKHLARFEFSAPTTPVGSSPPSSLTIQVFPPDSKDGDGMAPFFKCTLTPWRWIPAFPANTAYVPLSLLNVQPPLLEPAARLTAAEFESELDTSIDAYDISKKNEEALLVGTERWTGFELQAKCKARGCWVEMGQEQERPDGVGEEDGKWWPNGLKPWSVGAWMEGGVFEIAEGLEWKL
ncbi:hypothetical protein CC86DRAFT_374237 [Ophiobolus disseminans]|uniref:Uncharacterized protein n=1 Tax=Ophiobolus disseminans TaxID=1469910 RepID=A0A6A6ZHC8_9PLEO|nr:hypothetical protein CC86DRAFT_374237 [Ophiobolus disseminans]